MGLRCNRRWHLWSQPRKGQLLFWQSRRAPRRLVTQARPCLQSAPGRRAGQCFAQSVRGDRWQRTSGNEGMGEKAHVSSSRLARNTAVERKALSDEMQRTVKLLADLQGLRGRVCKRCESALCHHESLFSIGMGFKIARLCCPCLATELERD